MAVRRLPIASLLFLVAGLSTPLMALADGTGIAPANGFLAPPTLGPFGMAGIAAGVAGMLVLISRGRRKGDGD